MAHAYWNDWYFAWGWFLWVGLFFLLFSSIGNWGYTYRVHRRYGQVPSQAALDILNARYARGEIAKDEYSRMKTEMAQA